MAGAEPAGQIRDEKNTYRYGTKHIYKSKYTKYTRCRPLLAIKLKYRKNIHHCNAIQIFYIQALLPTDAFKQKHLDTEKHKPSYTQRFLHTDPFTHKHLYTQTLLHRKFYTQTDRPFYTQRSSHKDAVTHRPFKIPFFLFINILT